MLLRLVELAVNRNLPLYPSALCPSHSFILPLILSGEETKARPGKEGKG